MDSADQSRTAVKKPDWMAEHLEMASFVEWDRFVVGTMQDHQYVDVYGWIERRGDDYKDFVWARFWPKNEVIEYTTSSDEYSEPLGAVWFGEDEGDHNPCRRVENTFDIPNAIELSEDAALEDFA